MVVGMQSQLSTCARCWEMMTALRCVHAGFCPEEGEERTGSGCGLCAVVGLTASVTGAGSFL